MFLVKNLLQPSPKEKEKKKKMNEISGAEPDSHLLDEECLDAIQSPWCLSMLRQLRCVLALLLASRGRARSLKDVPLGRSGTESTLNQDK